MTLKFTLSNRKLAVQSFRFLPLFLLALSVLVWTACGNGGMSATPSSTNTQIRIGDSPVDSVVSFELTVNSIALTPAGGGAPVTILSTPTRVEVTHTSATFEPLAVVNIPAGTYGAATLTVSNPEVVIINPVTRQPQQLTPSMPSATGTVIFGTPITVGSNASVLLVDLDLANSLSIVSSAVFVTPVFNASFTTIAAQTQQDDGNGKIEDITGVVTSVSGSSFTISVQQHATPLTFDTNTSTEFKAPLANISSIQVGMIVEVDAVTQSTGALLATEVESEVEVNNGLELKGFVTSVANPATQFKMVVHESASPTTGAPAVGTEITVNIAGNTDFRVDDDHVDLSGVNLVFDAASLRAGQKVEVDVEPPIGTPITAKKVVLKRQTLNGVISNLVTGGTSTATFTLTVDPNFSAFALVSGQSTLTVLRQPGTQLKNLADLSNNQNVRVRGLVFFDTATSSFKMVAGRITP